MPKRPWPLSWFSQDEQQEVAVPPSDTSGKPRSRPRGALIESLLAEPGATSDPANGPALDALLGALPAYPEGRLTKASSVLTVIPHYRCEPWLDSCLTTMVGQTRPPEAIVVVDDGSGEPPVDIVRRFPEVTLLAAAENVGPYLLIQEVIDRTGYDAYLFQDADDWSTRERLELLLAEAERSQAELVGCQDIWLNIEEGEALTFAFPLDANAALAMQPGSTPLHHGTSLVARDLVMRLGGFATGLRYNGDTEFLRRAGHVARIVNIPQFCYFYRIWAGSLTGRPETGLRSEGRLAVLAQQQERAKLNAERVQNGEAPLLEPTAVAPSIPLTHLTGPTLDVDWSAVNDVARARQTMGTLAAGGDQPAASQPARGESEQMRR